MTTIQMKRVYDTAASSDGYRVFVDKLWPRGVKKEALNCDEWNKEIEPSPALRSWFHTNKEENWDSFKTRYTLELEQSEAVKRFVKKISSIPIITLVYGAKDPVHNHVVVLKAFLESKCRT